MSEPWCDLCDLPLDTCVHGRPPTPPPDPAPRTRGVPARVPGTAPRKTPLGETAPRSTTRSTARATTPRAAAKRTPAVRRAEVRRTPQAAFRPFILAALQERGGSCEVEELMEDLHERMADVLLDGDEDTIGRNELRWRYSARFERKALTDEGLMEPVRTPGVWELTAEGLDL